MGLTARYAAIGLLLATGFSNGEAKMNKFKDDVSFLKKHTDVIVLSDKSDKAQLAVVPAYQGRVMTSTAKGGGGMSFGWINRGLVASGKIQPHINAYGGEERFWMGPERGQFAIYFAKGVPFDFEHWQVPAEIDTEPFNVEYVGEDSVTFNRTAELMNWSGTQFRIRIDRTVRLLSKDDAAGKLGTTWPRKVSVVAYQSENKITNIDSKAWSKETGVLSIWILSMFTPSEKTTVVIPFKAGSEEELGPKVNDEYFGKVPADRLVVSDDVLFFKADGKSRGKIGLSPKRARPTIGSYDAANKVLTLVQYTQGGESAEYVNSIWQMQEDPYSGDMVNSYNDGPVNPGEKPMGPFYELESSSPAVELGPNESLSHTHRVFHLVGPEKDLDEIAKATLGVTLDAIKSAL
jgi:hypothetical protein